MRDVGNLIERARRLVTASPTAAVWERVEQAAKNQSAADGLQIAIWTHLVIGNDMTEMFSAMIGHQAAMAQKFMPGCWYHVSRSTGLNMFDRCLAMCAYVHSPAFNVPAVFLDCDAFPNGNLRKVFEQVSDVGLTVRHELGLMPVNEGVIFAQPTDAARAFFKSYLGTYEALREMLDEKDWLWWGGQLALNAINAEAVWRLQNAIDGIEDAPITRLPCSTHNFSPDLKRRYRREELDEKVVIHMKGPRKVQFDQVRAYQEARCASLS